LALTNLLALWALYPIAMHLLKDYEQQLAAGNSPRFHCDSLPQESIDPASWPARYKP